MCWRIPDVPAEVEMPKREVGFTEAGSLRTVSFMIYRDGKFGGVQYTEYEPEHKVDFGGATNVD